MRLRRLDLTRYGKFTDHVIDFGEKADDGADFHVIYGLNEAGKSTALSGFLDLLFGIEERSRYGFLHQYGAMEVGAVLEFGGKLHEVRRVKQRGGSLRDASGQPLSEAFFAGALAGLTREAYRMMFSLDDQTLEDGGNAILDSKGDLGELLFSASAGLAGLSKALAAVATEADAIFRKRASTTEIAGLKRRLTELKVARDAIDIQASAYVTLVTNLRRAEQAYDEAARERGWLKARQDELGCLLRAAPLAAEHARLGEDLAGLANLPRPPSHWAADLPGLTVNDVTLQTKLLGLDERIERLRVEIERIDIDDGLLRLADQIQALPSASARFQTAEADLPKRRAALSESRARLAALARSLTGQDGGIDPDRLVVSAAVLGALRGLIEEWSGVETKLAGAEAELEASSLALDRATDERLLLDREAPQLGAAQKAALLAAISRLREGDLLARGRLAARTASSKAQAADDAVRLLSPWTGGPEDLERLTVPSLTQIQAWRDTLADQNHRRSNHGGQRRNLETEQAALKAKIVAVEAFSGSISDEEAAALRRSRDQAWEAHRQSLNTESASAFERLMGAFDTMAEARLVSADQLAEMRGLRRELAVSVARTTREVELLAEIERETADLAIRIKRACPIGIEGARTTVGEAITGIEAWIKKRDRAVNATQELRTANAELESIEAELESEGRGLAEALAAAGLNAETLDIATLLQAAEAQLANDATQAQARAVADKLVRDCTRTLDARRKSACAAAEGINSWEERWTRALSGTWLLGRATDRGAVRSIIDAVADLPARLAERDDIRHRIAAMEGDQQDFLSELKELHEQLGERLDPDAAAAAGAALLDRYGIVSRSLSLRRSKEEELAGLEQERTALLTELAIHVSRRTEILTFFGLEDLTAVSACLERCAQRDRVEEGLKKLASQIMRETGSISMESALARLAEMNPAERAGANAECVQRMDHLDDRLRSLFAAKSGASDRLAAVGGDDTVARIEADRRNVTLQIEDKALRFLHLRTGSLLAERALQVYRDKHRGPMMRRASEAFRAMTRDSYSGLATRPEKDRETLIGVQRSGGSKLTTDMSKGTRFQLYLALRLAGYEEFASSRQAVPFLADDIMETFDEPRSQEVLSLFGKMSRVGQVIYLTHHRHLCELARKIVPNVTLHELPS